MAMKGTLGNTKLVGLYLTKDRGCCRFVLTTFSTHPYSRNLTFDTLACEVDRVTI